MKTTAISTLSVACLVLMFLFLNSCGQDQYSVSDAALDLQGVSLSQEMSGPLMAARKRSRLPVAANLPAGQTMARYSHLSHSINGISATAAVDSLFFLWSNDPENLVYLDLALRSSPLLKDDPRYPELLSIGSLSDTTTAVGCFRMGYENYRRQSGGRWLLKCDSLQDELDPLQKIWLNKWLAIVDQGDLRPDDGVRRLLAQLEKAWEIGGMRLEFELWTTITNGLLAGGHLDDALHTAALAGTLARAVGDSYLQTRAEFWLGLVMMGRDDLVAAEKQFQTAADLSTEYGFNWMRKVSNNRLAKVLDQQGDYPGVLKMNRANLALVRATGDSINIPIIMMNIAHAHRAMGRLDSCRVYQDLAIDCVEKFPHPTNVARLPMMLAEYYAQVGQYATLDSLLNVALENPTNGLVAEEMVDLHMGLIQGGLEQGHAGLVHRSIVQVDSLRQLSLSRGEQINIYYGDDLMIAEFYIQQGEFARAVVYLDQARASLAESDSPEAQWKFRRAEGLLARERGDLDTALASFREGLSIIRDLDNPDLQARGRYLLGSALLDAGQYEEARALFPEADKKQQFGGRFRTRLSSRLFRGMTFSRAGDFEKGVHEFQKALKICSPHSPDDLVVRIHLELGQALKVLGDIPTASQHLQLAWAKLVNFDETRDDALGEAFHGNLRRDVAEAMMDLFINWPETSPGPNAAAATLDLRNILTRSFVEEETGQSWRPGQIVFFTGTNASYRWMISPHGVEVAILPAATQLQQMITPVLSDMTSPGRRVTPEASRQLSEFLLTGVESVWPRGEVLYLVCDGPLGNLPWAALPLPSSFGDEAGRSLLAWGPPVYQMHISRKGIKKKDRDLPGRRLLAVGSNTGIEDELENLTHAEDEARAIGALWPENEAVILLGSNASWKSMKECDLNSFAAIHLASHARIYQGLPEQSYLVLSGARGQEQLSARSVSTLHLNADLVYLSSCEAAATVAGSAVGGFVQAFIDAGAKSVIASSLGVDDEASRYLAQRVYEHWLSGSSLPECLRLAQLDLTAAEPRWDHPFYWGFYRIYQ